MSTLEFSSIRYYVGNPCEGKEPEGVFYVHMMEYVAEIVAETIFEYLYDNASSAMAVSRSSIERTVLSCLTDKNRNAQFELDINSLYEKLQAKFQSYNQQNSFSNIIDRNYLEKILRSNPKLECISFKKTANNNVYTPNCFRRAIESLDAKTQIQ
ncbi:MAG: hypothetical protein ABIH39_08960, partial [Candidatus Margulisiibacteriota bacterium]